MRTGLAMFAVQSVIQFFLPNPIEAISLAPFGTVFWEFSQLVFLLFLD